MEQTSEHLEGLAAAHGLQIGREVHHHRDMHWMSRKYYVRNDQQCRLWGHVVLLRQVAACCVAAADYVQDKATCKFLIFSLCLTFNFLHRWLPVDHSFSRNDTVAAIKAGKYNNIHLMAGGSGNNPSTFHPGGEGYGRKNGSNPWMTAAQAIATGSSASSGGSYPLFKLGAACWYFGQRLSELGVDVPIGLADTAIGGQRIEEYMNNATINRCQNRSSENIPWWDGELWAQQVIPFVDMTVKGWVWYQVRPPACHLYDSFYFRVKITWAR